jgi:hypothetical protein
MRTAHIFQDRFVRIPPAGILDDELLQCIPPILHNCFADDAPHATWQRALHATGIARPPRDPRDCCSSVDRPFDLVEAIDVEERPIADVQFRTPLPAVS